MPDDSTGRIRQDLEASEKRVASLEADLANAKARVDRLRTALEVIGEYEGSAVATEHPFASLTIAEAAVHVIVARGGTAQLTDVRDELRRAGKLKGKAETQYGTLVQTFKRHPDLFEQVARGVWRLVGAPSANGAQPDTGASPEASQPNLADQAAV